MGDEPVAKKIATVIEDLESEAELEGYSELSLDAPSVKTTEVEGFSDLSDLYSSALYDLEDHHLERLDSMPIIEEEIQSAGDLALLEAALAGDREGIEEALAMIALEEGYSVIDIPSEEELQAELIKHNLEASTLLETAPEYIEAMKKLDPKFRCIGTCDKYIEQISELTIDLAETRDFIDELADALADIDPNMDTPEEGKALLRKMYKMKGHEDAFESTTPIMPETPMECVELVAGKVIQVEDLHEDLESTQHFRDYFSEVYCNAYINSQVTMKDGLSQIFPGGLDKDIEDELSRVYGPFDSTAELNEAELTAVISYMDAIEANLYKEDDSILIEVAEPLEQAFAICRAKTDLTLEQAKRDREDYLTDYNFLRYLRTL